MRQILFALPNDNLGGAELYLKNLAHFFQENGFRVTIFFLKKSEAKGWEDLINKKNIDLIFTNSSSERSGVIPFFLNIFKFRKIEFEYVFTSHVHVTGLIGFMIKLGLVKKQYFIGRESTSIFCRFKGWKLFIFKIQYYLGYPALDLLICQTDFMQSQLKLGLTKLSAKIKIVTIPNPISVDTNKSIYIEKKLPFQEYIVSAGRLISEKGFDILISAFSKLETKFPNLNLIILGEGKLRDVLQKQIKDLDLNGKILMPGFVDNIYPYFRDAKLCVVSSRIEGFPNVLLQMMSQNTNVVSTKCAGGIENLKGVYISETNDVTDLATQMENCLTSDNTKNRKLFDAELNSRSVESFVSKIDYYLNEA